MLTFVNRIFLGGFLFAFRQLLIWKLVLTGTEEHLDASTVTYTRVSHLGDDEKQSSHSTEAQEEESDNPDGYSGQIPPAEVAAVSEELGSGMEIPVVDGHAVTLLTLPFLSVTPSTPPGEAELSSSEVITFVPEAGAAPEVGTVEDLREEESGFSTTHSDMNQREHDAGEGSGGSSGESEEEATSVIQLKEDRHEDQDVKTPLIPLQTLTPDWEPEPSSPSSSSSSDPLSHDSYSSSTSASLSSFPYTPPTLLVPQGSHTDEESSAELTTYKESDGGEVEPSTEQPSAQVCTWNPLEEQQQEEEAETSSFTTDGGHVTSVPLTAQRPEGSEEEVVMAAAEVVAAVQVTGDSFFFKSNFDTNHAK